MSDDIQEFEDMNRTDELDRAASLTMRNTADAEAAIRARLAPERVPNGDGTFTSQVCAVGGDPDSVDSYPFPDCTECGDPIPLKRLQWGRICCTGCQERKENPRKR